jgi:hypothetical protein
MHRAKPSLREGMQSWLDTLWVCNKFRPIVNIPSIINRKWHSREPFPTVFVSKKCCTCEDHFSRNNLY